MPYQNLRSCKADFQEIKERLLTVQKCFEGLIEVIGSMQPSAGKKSTIQSFLESLRETIQSISAPEFQNTPEKSILDEEPEVSPRTHFQIPVQIQSRPIFQKNSIGLIDDGTGMNINLNSNIMVSLGS